MHIRTIAGESEKLNMQTLFGVLRVIGPETGEETAGFFDSPRSAVAVAPPVAIFSQKGSPKFSRTTY
jgi:hypothetical protein